MIVIEKSELEMGEKELWMRVSSRSRTRVLKSVFSGDRGGRRVGTRGFWGWIDEL